MLSYAEETGPVLRPKTMEVLVGEEVEAKRWIKYTNKILTGECRAVPCLVTLQSACKLFPAILSASYGLFF